MTQHQRRTMIQVFAVIAIIAIIIGSASSLLALL